MAAALDMFCGHNCVAEALKLGLCYLPRTPAVVLFEVPDVLEQDIAGLVFLQNHKDVVKEGSASVRMPILETRL